MDLESTTFPRNKDASHRNSPYVDITNLQHQHTRPDLANVHVVQSTVGAAVFGVIANVGMIAANRAGMSPVMAVAAGAGATAAATSTALSSHLIATHRLECYKVCVGIAEHAKIQHGKLKANLYRMLPVSLAVNNLHEFFETLHQWEAALRHLPAQKNDNWSDAQVKVVLNQWAVHKGYRKDLEGWYKELKAWPSESTVPFGLHSGRQPPAPGSSADPNLLHHVGERQIKVGEAGRGALWLGP